MNLKSRFIGSMIGTAIGDSLGSSVEGSTIYSLESLNISLQGGWTDDTHMMIGVAESLIACRGFDVEHMALTFVRNYEKEPWRGYGPGPPRVFKMIKAGIPWREASRRLYGGVGSFGNGAAMRIAPVALLFYDDFAKLREVAYYQSIITHTHQLGIEGAVIQAYSIALALRSGLEGRLDPSDFLSKLIDLTRNEIYREKLEKCLTLLRESGKKKVVKELGNGFEAYNSVPTSIYCFLRNKDSFKESVIYAVSLGGDTDTIGAMTGAISGAYHGVEKIPEDWRNKIEKKEYIEHLAIELWNLKRNL